MKRFFRIVKFLIQMFAGKKQECFHTHNFLSHDEQQSSTVQSFTFPLIILERKNFSLSNPFRQQSLPHKALILPLSKTGLAKEGMQQAAAPGRPLNSIGQQRRKQPVTKSREAELQSFTSCQAVQEALCILLPNESSFTKRLPNSGSCGIKLKLQSF